MNLDDWIFGIVGVAVVAGAVVGAAIYAVVEARRAPRHERARVRDDHPAPASATVLNFRSDKHDAASAPLDRGRRRQTARKARQVQEGGYRDVPRGRDRLPEVTMR